MSGSFQSLVCTCHKRGLLRTHIYIFLVFFFFRVISETLLAKNGFSNNIRRWERVISRIHIGVDGKVASRPASLPSENERGERERRKSWPNVPSNETFPLLSELPHMKLLRHVRREEKYRRRSEGCQYERGGGEWKCMRRRGEGREYYKRKEIEERRKKERESKLTYMFSNICPLIDSSSSPLAQVAIFYPSLSPDRPFLYSLCSLALSLPSPYSLRAPSSSVTSGERERNSEGKACSDISLAAAASQ